MDVILDFDFLFDADVYDPDPRNEFKTNQTPNPNFIRISIRDFVNQMQSEKLYTPPIRIVFAGDDSEFNSFVSKYMEHVLGIDVEQHLDDGSDEGFEHYFH